MNPKRQAYFLDRRILTFFKNKTSLFFASDRELYCMLKQEQAVGALQGVRLCKEKTFYHWLAQGRKEMAEKNCHPFDSDMPLSKTGQLARHIARLKKAMHFSVMNGLYQSALKSEKVSEIISVMKLLGISKSPYRTNT